VSARRSANGLIGGLHRNRRLEQLAGPIVEAVLNDANLDGKDVEEIVIGNTTAGGGNPARLIALCSGIPETASASSVDRQCASGLESLATAIRLIVTGAANIVVAGGAEAPSTAPWRVAKPKAPHLQPHFHDPTPFTEAESGIPEIAQAAENLSKKFKIERKRQDAFALHSHKKAQDAYSKQSFSGEITPIRIEAGEGRDESLRDEISSELLAQMPAYFSPDGSVTSGNSSPVNDGTAVALVVSEDIYSAMGKPPALRILNVCTVGVNPGLFGMGSVPAVQKILHSSDKINLSDIGHIEVAETSAAQVLACADQLSINEELINPDGGSIALGHPLGASSAVMITRLFSRMVRNRPNAVTSLNLGMATMGAAGGLGTAAIFEAV
ncbi:MAG: thiolase family protein, partial [Desulfobulbia bacterium]